MLLVDDTTVDGTHILGHYHVRGDEFFLQGHFPGNPVVPGVILCEIMAQCCGLVVGEEVKQYYPMYAGIDKVRFKRQVVPGDTITVNAELVNRRGSLLQVEAKATVEGEVCCSGRFDFYLVKKEN